MSCEFSGSAPPVGQLQILVRDAVRTIGSAGSGVCRSPVTGLARPTVRDILFTAGAAVGGPVCELCECDVNDGGVVDASDLFIVANAALGAPAPLDCPPCGYPSQVRGAGLPVSVVVSDINCSP